MKHFQQASDFYTNTLVIATVGKSETKLLLDLNPFSIPELHLLMIGKKTHLSNIL